jgi:predicted metal-dependent hydrolase
MNIEIDRIIRSRRRTLALIVERDGKVVVRAPLRTPETLIRQFVQDHADWVVKKQAQLRQQPPLPVKRYVDGESFLYLGQPHPLAIVERLRPGLALENGRFLLSKSAHSSATDLFTRLYKKLAQEYIFARTKILAQKYGFTYKKLRITSARTRWGSCSSTGTVSFAWRLVMAPPEVIDYVIVHELVHLKIKNHSKKFWGGVAELMPAYKKHVDWLKKNGKFLVV